MDTFRKASEYIVSEIASALKAIKEEQQESLMQSIQQAKRVFFVGAGRSCLMLNAFCMRLNHLGIESYVAGNIPCPPVGQEDLVIAMTGSGSTASVLAITSHSKEYGTTVFAITAGPDTLIEKISDKVLYIPAPTKESPSPGKTSSQLMGTLFEQVASIIFDTIIMQLSEDRDLEKIAARHTNLE
ncbi:6-phospho-3-hexuloisomerase [uncultured Sphaerochaeta sp.]|jgi:6-phospho-3-hexuloisomerase|uniref:6-phospho-3-hexuloisomerase n=1 Tax=uncultured Sphaerochaeta sp. TaxID=886478 RepID=UPI002A0A1ADC|nr:6-phospho-3-hexuloisomerase [uncultured Sphaerochaeta sp.]